MAVEERGVGYRVNSHFPDGELSGDAILTGWRTCSPAEVRSCDHPRPQLHRRRVRGARRRTSGLHGTNYVVGWTAWLDLAPWGVSKASGLSTWPSSSA